MEKRADFQSVAAQGKQREAFLVDPFAVLRVGCESGKFRRLPAGIFGQPVFCVETLVEQFVERDRLAGAQIEVVGKPVDARIPGF